MTVDISIALPQGWSMFGYTCVESVNVIGGFASISDKIEIVKDEWGLAYLPEWGFSAFDNLEFGEGYQIKMTEEVSGFQFCYTIVGTSSQEEAEPEAEALQIGDQHAGGIVFQINEDGTGLVADLQDLGGEMNWTTAIEISGAATSQDYDDWYLPSIEELEIMYNTIGQGADNSGGFYNSYYWSSSEYMPQQNGFAWIKNFQDGGKAADNKSFSNRVRAIRAF